MANELVRLRNGIFCWFIEWNARGRECFSGLV